MKGILGLLDTILVRDGFVIFVCGGKEKGKTEFSLFLGEYCFAMGYRTKVATNIDAKASDYSIRQITYFDDLKEWLKSSGLKLFILDEAGKHIRKLRFMTEKNILIMDTIQLIRHYDCGFIGVAPSETFIDNNFLNTDILDAKIRKLSKKKAKVFDYLNRDSYFLEDIPKTSISFNSKDVANFRLKKPPDLTKMQECCRVALLYSQGNSTDQIAKTYSPPRQRNYITGLLRKHLKHSMT